MAKTTRRIPATLGISIVALLAIGSAVGAGYFVAQNSGDDVATQAGAPTDTRPAPTATVAPPTEGEDPGAAAGHQLIYSEFGATSDRILAFDPANNESSELLSVPHEEFYGINGAVSPTGAIAYLVLPEVAGDANLAASSQSELWVLDGGEPTRLGQGYDLRQAPAWLPDGSAVAVQSIDFQPDSPTASAAIDLVSLDGSVRTLVDRSNTGNLAVLGFTEDGSTLFFGETLPAGETSVQQIDMASGATSEVARGSDYIELVSWRVSGDGQVAAIVNNTTATEEARNVVVIGGGNSASRVAPPTATPGISSFSPAWSDEGLSFAVEPSAAAEGVRLARTSGDSELPALSSGFDAPRFWSADSTLLAGLHFSEFPVRGPGTPFILLEDGTRVTVPASGEVTLFGWR